MVSSKTQTSFTSVIDVCRDYNALNAKCVAVMNQASAGIMNISIKPELSFTVSHDLDIIAQDLERVPWN
jgi:hypothetical protein